MKMSSANSMKKVLVMASPPFCPPDEWEWYQNHKLMFGMNPLHAAGALRLFCF